MVDIRQNKERTLNNHELVNELSSLVARSVIPSFIADKIRKKLYDANVELTLNQLYELVDIIKDRMRTTEDYPRPSRPISEDDYPSDYDESDEDFDLDNMLKAIEKLSDRIKKIEEASISGYNESVGRIVTTDDIDIPEKINIPRVGKVCTLQRLPTDPESIIVLMKWLQYLLDKVGKANLTNVLEYYVDIGWMSDKVIPNLMEYSEGITEEKEGREPVKKLTDLKAKDHIESLLYIQRLNGIQPDSYFINRIERELSKMTKNLGNI